MSLWHFTCEHTHLTLGESGELVPAAALTADLLNWWPARYVWFSDLGYADREGLGLTNSLRGCDRTVYRYRATDESAIRPWLAVRKQHRAQAHMLEIPGTRPAHWFVAGVAVPVVLDQRASPWQPTISPNPSR